ncbi:hypothetical protein TWF694_008889 [Orbilia ellipsospora]|uniref:Uncharacterized protein n=1 Tax=Orbilia ellipsospora TaxID=2528407 RepID=A0AAV9XG02_9PEZI
MEVYSKLKLDPQNRERLNEIATFCRNNPKGAIEKLNFLVFEQKFDLAIVYGDNLVPLHCVDKTTEANQNQYPKLDGRQAYHVYEKVATSVTRCKGVSDQNRNSISLRYLHLAMASLLRDTSAIVAVPNLEPDLHKRILMTRLAMHRELIRSPGNPQVPGLRKIFRDPDFYNNFVPPTEEENDHWHRGKK